MQARLEESNATRSVALGDLRAFVTLMVVAHHAVLPYVTTAPPRAAFAEAPLLWTAFPVLDEARWSGFDLLVGYDDTFFMSLMFFLSGVFVWPSLTRKGPLVFLRDRARRLGIPFAVSAALLAPLAYYPCSLQAGDGFRSWWLSLHAWPAGPAWFLWVLLAFGALAAALTRIAPRWGDAMGRAAGALERPALFFTAIVALTAVVYVPVSAWLEPTDWVHFGPFFVQASRALHYAVWFFAGVGAGAYGIERGLLAPGGRLARRWWAWAVASLLTYVVELVLVVLVFQALSKGEAPGTALATSARLGFVVVCGASCLAFIGAFLRFARPSRVFESLSANAYGIYLTHYAAVSWIAYALLGAHLPAAAKGALVFVGASVVSWALTAAVRRIPAVARVV